MSGFGFGSSNNSSSLFGGSSTSAFGSSSVFGQNNNTMNSNNTLMGGSNQTEAKNAEVVSPPEDSISSLAFSPASLPQNYLIAGSWDNKISCWEIQQMGNMFQSVPKAQQTSTAPVLDACWSDVCFFLHF